MQPGLTTDDTEQWTKIKAGNQKSASDTGYLSLFNGQKLQLCCKFY